MSTMDNAATRETEVDPHDALHKLRTIANTSMIMSPAVTLSEVLIAFTDLDRWLRAATGTADWLDLLLAVLPDTATPDEPVSRIAAARALEDLTANVMRATVVAERLRGTSWDTIATALGTSRSGAHGRFGQHVNQWREEHPGATPGMAGVVLARRWQQVAGMLEQLNRPPAGAPPVTHQGSLRMARFPVSRTEEVTYGGKTMPRWMAFIRDVNRVRPGTFDMPVNQHDTPRGGYLTEWYPAARVIFAPEGRESEGVRVVADSPEVAAAFEAAAQALGITLSCPVTGGGAVVGEPVWDCLVGVLAAVAAPDSATAMARLRQAVRGHGFTPASAGLELQGVPTITRPSTLAPACQTGRGMPVAARSYKAAALPVGARQPIWSPEGGATRTLASAPVPMTVQAPPDGPPPHICAAYVLLTWEGEHPPTPYPADASIIAFPPEENPS